MSPPLSEHLPSFSNSILQAVDSLKGNPAISSEIIKGIREINIHSITKDTIAGDLTDRIKTVDKYIFPGEDKIAKKWEKRKLKRELRVVNAIRFNGETAFVTQYQRYSVANSLTERLVGARMEFTFGERQDKVQDAARQKEFSKVFDKIAVTLGHKDTINRLKREADERKEDRQF